MAPTTSASASTQARSAPLGQLVQGSANARLRQLLGPAAKAYMLGYLVEAIPSILKHILRFINSHARRLSHEAKRFKEEREVALERERSGSKDAAGGSKLEQLENKAEAVAFGTRQASWLAIKGVLRDLPTLLSAILGSLSTSAVSPTGMAVCSTLTILLWRLLDLSLLNALEKVLDKQIGSSARVSTTSRSVATCFVAAAFASASSLIILQSGEEANNGAPPSASAPSDTPLDKRSMRRSSSNPALLLKRLRGITNPLAPGGHFLSRLTNLSIPATPQIQPDADGLQLPPPSSPLLAPPGSREGSASPALLTPRPVSPVAGMKGLSPSGTQQQQQQSRSTSGLSVQIPVTTEKGSAGSSGKEARTSKPKPSSTIDFTLFALVRGLDTFVRVFPILLSSRSAVAAQSSAARTPNEKGRAKAENVLRKAIGSAGHLLASQAEGFVFVVCCAQIMFSWFYYPERLPPTYNKWITNLATMDQRLLLALRSRRTSKPFYWAYRDPKVTPAGTDLCASLSESLGHPYEWGDPVQLPVSSADARQMLARVREANRKAAEAQGRDFNTLSKAEQDAGYVFVGAAGARGRGEMGGLPCEVVHCGVGGSSCLANAGLRWFRGWKASMAIYLPVHLLPRLIFGPKQFMNKPLESLLKVSTGAARSAAFLATFISSIWFMVCVGRTLLLPKLFPQISHNFWDAGLGPLMGSWACGFSVFIEERRKRAEMALYVAPRALFAVAESLKPGWISDGRNKSARTAERIIFGLSAGLVITTAKYRPDLLRGIPSIMAWVVKESNGRKISINAPRGQ